MPSCGPGLGTALRDPVEARSGTELTTSPSAIRSRDATQPRRKAVVHSATAPARLSEGRSDRVSDAAVHPNEWQTERMVVVRYSGPPRGAHVLAAQLSDAGLRVDFSPPEERRGVGQEIVHVLLRVESDVEAGVVGEQRLRRCSASFVRSRIDTRRPRSTPKTEATNSSRPYCFAQAPLSVNPAQVVGARKIQPRDLLGLELRLRRAVERGGYESASKSAACSIVRRRSQSCASRRARAGRSGEATSPS